MCLFVALYRTHTLCVSVCGCLSDVHSLSTTVCACLCLSIGLCKRAGSLPSPSSPSPPPSQPSGSWPLLQQTQQTGRHGVFQVLNCSVSYMQLSSLRVSFPNQPGNEICVYYMSHTCTTCYSWAQSRGLQQQWYDLRPFPWGTELWVESTTLTRPTTSCTANEWSSLLDYNGRYIMGWFHLRMFAMPSGTTMYIF